jgi:hypothetical protein
VAASLLAGACKSPSDTFPPAPGCDPACDDAHICCYNFTYETPNPEGGDPLRTYPDAAQDFVRTPTCAIPFTRDAGGSGQVRAVEDGGPGVCTIIPPV